MADLDLDQDGPGGQLAVRKREVAAGVYADAVVLTDPLDGIPAQVSVANAVDVTGSTVTVAEPVTVDGTVSITGPVTVDPVTPAAADVVGGFANAAAGTVLTVPAGRTWRGTLQLQASAVNGLNAAAVTRTARLVLAGAGATPAAGTLVELALALPVTGATATSGVAMRDSATIPDVVIVAAGVDAVLTLQGDATAMRASARGVLL